ncbi:MAG TPA: hypothetical protein VHD90_08435 [Phototrophicaceae bacterium]|nr:hypothetical protein [Phototrophicaceae bacterium]
MSRRFTINPEKPFFIFDTAGEWHATALGWSIFDGRGDYIGFIRNEAYDVYTTSGEWIGNIIADGRIIRNRNVDRPPLLKKLPPKPPKPKLPSRAPLAPLPGDLGFSKLDVLEWDPEIFKRVSDLIPDAGEDEA